MGHHLTPLGLDLGTAELGSLPVRVPSAGQVLQPHAKTKRSARTVVLPRGRCRASWTGRSTRCRTNGDVVFCSALGKLRGTSNTSEHVRALLGAARFEWAVGHTFRKTDATWLDVDDVSGRQVATQLGHAKPSMTMEHYMSRRAASERTALVIQRFPCNGNVALP